MQISIDTEELRLGNPPDAKYTKGCLMFESKRECWNTVFLHGTKAALLAFAAEIVLGVSGTKTAETVAAEAPQPIPPASSFNSETAPYEPEPPRAAFVQAATDDDDWPF